MLSQGKSNRLYYVLRSDVSESDANLWPSGQQATQVIGLWRNAKGETKLWNFDIQSTLSVVSLAPLLHHLLLFLPHFSNQLTTHHMMMTVIVDDEDGKDDGDGLGEDNDDDDDDLLRC